MSKQSNTSKDLAKSINFKNPTMDMIQEDGGPPDGGNMDSDANLGA